MHADGPAPAAVPGALRDPRRLAAVEIARVALASPRIGTARLTAVTASLLQASEARVDLVEGDCADALLVRAVEEGRVVSAQEGVGTRAAAPVRSPDGIPYAALHVRRGHPWGADDDVALAAMASAVAADAAAQEAELRAGDAASRADFTAALLRAAQESSPDGVMVVSPEGRTLSWTARFQALWPVAPEALESESDDAALASVVSKVVDPEAFLARVHSLYADPRPARDEVHLRDGRVLDRYGTPIVGDDGTHYGYAWFARDVTEERRTAEAVEASEERFRSLVRAMADEVWRASPSGELLSDLPAWREWTGQRPEDLLGAGWLASVHPDDRDRAARAWREAVSTGGTYDVEYRIGRVPAEGEEWDPAAPCRTLAARGVPIRRGGEVVEWVGVYTDVTHLRDAEEAERRASAVAAVAAERTLALQEVTAALSGAVTPSDVMAVVLDAGRRVLGARGSGVALRHGDLVRYEVLEGYSADVKASWQQWRLDDDTPVTRAVRTGEPAFYGSPEALLEAFPTHERLRSFVEASGERAFARLPLQVPSGRLGALVFGWSEERAFDEGEQRFLLALAGQCAQALERARLYERERGNARLLQRSLLPERLPDVPGLSLAAVCQPVSPGTEVSGDWYDAVLLDDGRLALVVGDVMGKGLGAASVMGQVRNALRGLLHADPDPGVVLGRLDAVVRGLGDPEELVTAACVLLDPASGEVQLARAGHVPPLLLGPDGAALVEAGGSPPLGLGGAPRPSTGLRLRAGESLVLVSDGLVENRSRPLGAGLAELLEVGPRAAAAAAGDAEALRDQLVRELQHPDGVDDVTALVACRRGVDAGHATAEVHLPARATSPSRARAFVRDHLGRWGADDDLCESALLCVSEVVTNAVVHAPSAARLVLRWDGGLRVEVHDDGRTAIPSERPAATLEDDHGRGLMLVETMSARWGVEPSGAGKCVWFEIAT